MHWHASAFIWNTRFLTVSDCKKWKICNIGVSKLLIWRQKWVTGVLLVVRRVSPGRIIDVLFWTSYAVPRQLKSGTLKLAIKRDRSNLSVVIFVSCEEKGYYRVVSVGQLSFYCRSYCGRSRRVQGYQLEQAWASSHSLRHRTFSIYKKFRKFLKSHSFTGPSLSLLWISREYSWHWWYFHWEVSTGKTGLPFPEFGLFRKISSGTNQTVVFHLYPNRNFAELFGKWKTLGVSKYRKFRTWPWVLFAQLATTTHWTFAGLSALDPHDPPTCVAKQHEAIKLQFLTLI